MLWREFEPLVMPYVVGCPIPTLVHHARLITADWCRKTMCYQKDLDAVLTDGEAHLIEMEPESQTQIVKVMAVAVGGRDWTLVDSRKGNQFVRSDHPGDFCFTQDNKNLSVYPLQVIDTEVVITAALMPDLKRAQGLVDDVAWQYCDDIAKGIIASIMLLPGKPFSNAADAVTHQGMYQSRRTTIAAKVSRGLLASKRRNAIGFV